MLSIPRVALAIQPGTIPLSQSRSLHDYFLLASAGTASRRGAQFHEALKAERRSKAAAGL